MSVIQEIRDELASEKTHIDAAVKVIADLAARAEAAHAGTSDEDLSTVLATMRANIAPLVAAVVTQTPAPVVSAPVEAAPVEAAPVVTAPVEAAPVEAAPVVDPNAPTS